MGDRRLSMEALHHPSWAPPTEATQYMSQDLVRAQGNETGSMFHVASPWGRSDARRSYIKELEPGRFDRDRG
jgi:hypothetical protein